MSLSCWGSLSTSPLPFDLTSLELVEEEVLLSSSLDRTVRLWSRDGAFIGKDHPPGHQFSPSLGPQLKPPSGREFSEVQGVRQIRLT